MLTPSPSPTVANVVFFPGDVQDSTERMYARACAGQRLVPCVVVDNAMLVGAGWRACTRRTAPMRTKRWQTC